MCVIFVAHAIHPSYPLIVAANRDEFHTRPTAPASWWTDQKIFAGRDLTAGGTWLGVSRRGRFAAITNYHGGAQLPDPPRSRGHLVSDFLVSSIAAFDYVRDIDRERFNGFSLFVHDGATLAFLSNRYGEAVSLPPGLYGLANASLDSDEPRVRELKRAISGMIERDSVSAEGLIDALARPPLFIVHDVHGTRCSTAVLIDDKGEVTFVERTFDVAGRSVGEVRETWNAGD